MTTKIDQIFQGKLALVSALVVGIAVGLQLSINPFQSSLLSKIFGLMPGAVPQGILLSTVTSNRRSGRPFEFIDSDSDLDSQLYLPDCLRYPFHAYELYEHEHFSLLGYVFKVPPGDKIFGRYGQYVSFTGKFE